jgi:carbon storage regulator
MLVISRKEGESLVISDNIRITIVSLGNDKVAIGIDAPREIKVMRQELLDTVQANKAAVENAAGADFKDLAELLKNLKK